MTHLYSALLGVAIVGLVGAYSMARHPAPPIVAQGAKPFEDTWNEDAAKIAVAVVVPPLPKVAPPFVPVEVRHPDPVPLPAIITQGLSEEHIKKLARAQRHRAHRGDVCARHGLRKVHYGRTWRCKKR